MVHPASGYLVGSLLRRAPALAKEIANVIKEEPHLPTSQIAKRGWQTLWPNELVQRHRLYQFGLQRLMSFDESLLRSFFETFFQLPRKDWYGYLTNTLHLPRLFIVMLKLFYIAPTKVRLGMIGLLIKK
jgi:lycopene beta-cyclase